MSLENVEVAKRMYEGFADGVNEEAVLRLNDAGVVDPDAELDMSTAYPDGPVVRADTLSEFLDTQPWGRTTRFEAESFRAVAGDRVLVFVRVHGIGTGSGVEVEARVAHALTIRDGRVVRVEVFTDLGNAVDAVGLSE